MMTLRADWQIADDQLRVAYRLTNRHPVAAYAYTVPRTASRLQPYPGSAYAILSVGDVDLTLLLGTCEPPEGADVPYRVQPLAVVVPPRKEIAGEIRLPVPVQEWGAYSPPADLGGTARPAVVYVVHLAVEYVLEGETYFCQQSPDGNWDVGGTPIRRVTATHVPDRPVPVLGNSFPS